ncbi:MAG: sugar phosphate isomerase/epimerase [Treponema sp.]|jgi:sugar phosphate isomerase/epimerase|nr:sugar phosphate isomerase/epimerase [Treponema sp.]
MKIATTTADFDGYTPNKWDYDLLLPLFEGTGFRNIDINFYGQEKPSPAGAIPWIWDDNWRGFAKRAMDAAGENGLKLVQAHSSDSVFDEGQERGRTIELIKREFEACKLMGIPSMVVHCVLKKGNTWKEQRETNCGFFTSLLPVLESTGVNLLIENGCFQNGGAYHYTSAEMIKTTIHDLGNHPLVHAVWDVGHAHMQGVDQYKEIMELGKDLYALHIHDNFGNADVHLAPYTGTCCYDAILKGLMDSGYNGYFTMEGNSIPTPKAHGRSGYELNGVNYNRLVDLPLDLKKQSERLMYETAKYMLRQYDCYEE